jgi:cytochrome bd-type quinol oxidase subunit 1
MGIAIALTMLIPAVAITDFGTRMPIELLCFFVGVLWFGLWLNMRQTKPSRRLKRGWVTMIAIVCFSFGFSCTLVDLFINRRLIYYINQLWP